MYAFTPAYLLQPNGGAIFYRKDKFTALHVEEFETSDTGNVAQAAVLRLALYPESNPIMSVNIHFQHGFTANDSELRVSEVSELFRVINNTRNFLLNYKYRSSDSLVISRNSHDH